MKNIILVILMFSRLVYAENCYLSTSKSGGEELGLKRCDVDIHQLDLQVPSKKYPNSKFWTSTCGNNRDSDLEKITLVEKGTQFHLTSNNIQLRPIVYDCKINRRKVFSYFYEHNQHGSDSSLYFTKNITLAGLTDLTGTELKYEDLPISKRLPKEVLYPTHAPVYNTCKAAMAGDFSFHACGYMSDTVMIYILFKGKYLGSIRHPNSDDAKVSPLNSFTYSGVQYQAFKIYSSSAARVVLLGQTKDRGYLSYIYGKCEKEVNSYVDSCDSTRFFD